MRFAGSHLRAAAAALVALALCAALAQAQSDIRRETVAVSYPLEQTVSLKFRGTTRLPRLSGSAKVKRTGRRNTRVEMNIDNLPRAFELGSIYTTYVLWAISPEGRADNLGELKRSGGMFVDTKIDVTTPLETFALVVTADVSVAANLEIGMRSGFRKPFRPTPRFAWDVLTRPRWFFGMFLRTLLRHGMPHVENMTAPRSPMIAWNAERERGRLDRLAWTHLELIRRRWKGRLVVKGILNKQDARVARESGADGIILSNHGGRQLDGAIAPLRVLPAIAADAGDMTVMIDSGIRRGTDVLKALGLGAQFVFIGRPILYAASIAGEAGVRHAIRLMKTEIDRDMALIGITSLAQMTAERLRDAREFEFEGLPGSLNDHLHAAARTQRERR